MKKIITLVVAVAFATTMFPQISFHGGGNVSQFVGKGSELFSTQMGYQVGITRFSNRLFSVEPGVFLMNKGALDKATDRRISLNYLQVPVNGILGLNITERWRVFAGAGVYAGLGLWGNAPGGVNFFDRDNQYKAFDFGWQVSIGTHWGPFGVRLGYQDAFTRVIREDNVRVRNNSFKFGISYTLGRSG